MTSYRLLIAALLVAACASTSSPPPQRAASAEVEKVVEAPAVQKLIVQALDDIALGRGEYHKHLSVPFMIGPALWGEMLQLDPTLAKVGTESLSVVPTGEGPKSWKMGGFMDEAAVQKIGHHIKFRAVAEAWRGGQLRPATPQERKLFYALTPLEIAGQPLTILTTSGHRLVVYVEDGRLVWIDLISAYVADLR